MSNFEEKQRFEEELAAAQAGNKPDHARTTIIALAVGTTVASLLYRGLERGGLGGSAAIFIGMPAVMAIALAFTPRARSVTGGIMRGITFMLLIVAPLLGEGWFCILIASPLFYLVGLVVGLIADHVGKKRNTTVSCIAVVLLPMSLEGVVPALTFDRIQTVTVTRTVNASCGQVEQSLARSPQVRVRLPLLLRIGFPVPLAATGGGIELGDQRAVLFSGVEGYPAGELVVRVSERRPGYVRFDAVSDASKLDHWMRWQDSEVTWTAIDATHTQVTNRIRFERRLDPAWYFVPWERAAVHEAAAYLIEAGAGGAQR